MRADTVRAGDVIWLPHRALADARRASDAQPKAAPAQETPQASSNSGSGRRTHEVGSGDSLWRIAERYYGREGVTQGVKRIVAANSKLRDENTVLRLGWVLVIPE